MLEHDELSWKCELTRFLAGARRVAVLGVGNPVRGDDGAGIYVAILLRSLFRRRPSSRGTEPPGSWFSIPAGAVPENYLSLVTRFRPTHIIVVDAFHQGSVPGTVSIIPTSSIEGVSLSSHQLPLGLIRDFLSFSGISQQLYIGIEPRCIDLGTLITPPVRTSSRKVAQAIARLVRCRGQARSFPT